MSGKEYSGSLDGFVRVPAIERNASGQWIGGKNPLCKGCCFRREDSCPHDAVGDDVNNLNLRIETFNTDPRSCSTVIDDVRTHYVFIEDTDEGRAKYIALKLGS